MAEVLGGLVTAAPGATATSTVAVGNVSLQAVAKPTSMAEVRRFADRQPWGRKRTGSFRRDDRQMRTFRSTNGRLGITPPAIHAAYAQRAAC
jgi:hypothetical protein